MKENGIIDVWMQHPTLRFINHPMILPGKCLQDLDALDLGEEAKALFLHENAKRVFAL